MYELPITYTTLNDEEVTDKFYFHLTRTEIIGLQLDHEGGIEGFIRRVSMNTDNKKMWEEFKRIILMAYGEKSEDGRKFVKSEELRNDFENSMAFDELLVQMMTDEHAVTNFLLGALPKQMSQAYTAAMAEEQKKTPPPVAPVPPLGA